jgi:hypothetical protein
MYTEMIQTMSLMAASRIFKLRIEKHAQSDVQEYAQLLDKIIRPKFPVAWSALCDD